MKKNYPGVGYLTSLAYAAEHIMLHYFQSENHVEWKGDGTPMTIADKKISDMIIANISSDFPHVSVVTEEGSRVLPDAEYIILCDPKDGSIPYLAGLPIAAFSIALLRNLEPIISVINDPFLKRLWIGEKDKLSTMNGNPISVSSRRELKRSNLCILNWPGAFVGFSKIIPRAQKRGAFCINPAAVSYFGGLLASGKYDGIMFPGTNYWEAIAIDLLVKGAGGITTDVLGNEITYDPNKQMHGMVSSNGYLHEELLSLYI